MSCSIIFVGSGDPSGRAPHHAMAALYLERKYNNIHYLSFGDPLRDQVKTAFGRLSATFIRGHGIFGHLRLTWKLFQMRLNADSDTMFYVYGSVNAPAAVFALFGYPPNRIVYHTQDYLELGRHPHWQFFERRIARKAGRVISNEPNRARFMASSYQLKNVPTVVRTYLPRDWPIPAFEDDFRQTLLNRFAVDDACKASGKIIMAGSNFSSVRCSEELMKALQLLSDNHLLVFTRMKKGSAQYRECKGLGEKLGVVDRVLLLDDMSYGDLLKYIAVCDVGMLVYPADGIGNYYQAPGRLTEYLRTGLPVVMSDCPGFKLLDTLYDIGAVCDSTSPEELAQTILKLTESGELDSDRRLRLRKLAETEFIYEIDAPKIEKIIKELMSA